MSAQRYTDPRALERMSRGTCPECGQLPDQHTPDPRPWIPRACDLRPDGVTDRIGQYAQDLRPHEPEPPAGSRPGSPPEREQPALPLAHDEQPLWQHLAPDDPVRRHHGGTGDSTTP